MALSPKEPQLKQAPMFSFTTTVSPTTPVSPPRASLADMKPRQLSITKDLVPLFFFHLERFQFGDASRVLGLASEGTDRVWVLLPHLQLFNACESIYHSLIFLEAFSNNEYLETMYGEVKRALDKVQAQWQAKHAEIQKFRPKGVSPSADAAASRYDAATQYYCHLLRDLILFIDCRLKLINLRLTLHTNVFDATPIELKRALSLLNSILLHLPMIKHQLLIQICQNLSNEVTLLQKLLQTELAIACYQTNEAIFNFHVLEMDLQSCRSKFTFMHEKPNSNNFLDTSLFHWNVSFRDNLYDKLMLLSSEFRALQEKAPIEQEVPSAKLMVQEKIMEFATQHDCFNVSLILKPADGVGKGTSSWVPVFSCPGEKAALSHWPSIISLYQDNSEQLDAPVAAPHSTKMAGVVVQPAGSSSASHGSAAKSDTNALPLYILHYYDRHVDTTYFMTSLQANMLLVILFTGNERKEDDPDVTAFMKSLFANSRYSQLLQKALARSASGPSTPVGSSRSASPAVFTTTNANATSTSSSVEK